MRLAALLHDGGGGVLVHILRFEEGGTGQRAANAAPTHAGIRCAYEKKGPKQRLVARHRNDCCFEQVPRSRPGIAKRGLWVQECR